MLIKTHILCYTVNPFSKKSVFRSTLIYSISGRYRVQIWHKIDFLFTKQVYNNALYFFGIYYQVCIDKDKRVKIIEINQRLTNSISSIMILGGMRRNEAFYTLHHFTRIALSRWPRLAILQLSFLGLLVHWLNHMSNVIKMDMINDKTHGYVLWQLW